MPEVLSVGFGDSEGVRLLGGDDGLGASAETARGMTLLADEKGGFSICESLLSPG